MVPLSLGLPQTMLVYQRVPIKSIMTNFNLSDLDSSWKITRILSLFSDLQAMDRVAEKVEDSWLQQWLWRTGWKTVISVDASIITCRFFSFFLGSAATMHEHVWTRKGGAQKINRSKFKTIPNTRNQLGSKNMYLRFLSQKKGLIFGDCQNCQGAPQFPKDFASGIWERDLAPFFAPKFGAIPGFTENTFVP